MKNSFLLVLLLVITSTILFAQKKNKTAAKKTSATSIPCMNVLPLFTAANVPAMAPEEEFASMWLSGCHNAPKPARIRFGAAPDALYRRELQ